MPPVTKPRISKKRLTSHAYHEAGHAAFALVRRLPVKAVWIKPLLPGQERLVEDPGEYVFGRLDLLGGPKLVGEGVMLSLAGPIAETWLDGSTDLRMGDSPGSDYDQIRAAFRGGFDEFRAVGFEPLWSRTDRFLKRNWDLVQAIALPLIERRYLDARELRLIYREVKAYRLQL